MTTTNKTAKQIKAELKAAELKAAEFNITSYVVTIGNQKNTEDLLKGLVTSAKAAHLAFYSYLSAGTVELTLASIKEQALHALQFVSNTWTETSGKLDGYQKAAKNGCLEATTYNRFTAWTVTNIHADGHILTADEKKEIAETGKATKTANEEKALQATIDQTIKDMNLVDAGSLVELTEDVCIQYLVAKGYKVTAPE